MSLNGETKAMLGAWSGLWKGREIFACIVFTRVDHSVGRSLASVTCYDPARDSWRRVAPLNLARQYPVTIAHNNRLYVMGGWSRGNQDTIEVGVSHSPCCQAKTVGCVCRCTAPPPTPGPCWPPDWPAQSTEAEPASWTATWCGDPSIP